MSRTAWATLAASGVFTCGIIYYVHYSQERDRKSLRDGVIIDLERQQKKLRNIYQLEHQADLTKILRNQQREQDEKERPSKTENS